MVVGHADGMERVRTLDMKRTSLQSVERARSTMRGNGLTSSSRPCGVACFTETGAVVARFRRFLVPVESRTDSTRRHSNSGVRRVMIVVVLYDYQVMFQNTHDVRIHRVKVMLNVE